MLLSRFPRVQLCHSPTPLERMPNLSAHLGGPRLWVKRDDCTGLAGGGNKTRKLDFLIGAALAEGADHIVTQGAVQSNHVRQTAAAAARFGLRCTALLEERVATQDRLYRKGGNVYLDELMGADIETRPAGADMASEMENVAERICAAGGRPYVIPGGGSNPVGALGYVVCAMELTAQANATGLSVASLVHATGSAGTQAGLVAGLKGAASDIEVVGVSVRAPQERQIQSVLALARRTAEFAGANVAIEESDVVVDDASVGPGYGVADEATIDAIRLLARLEGVLLDPVYTGKGMAGLIAMVLAGRFAASDDVVFLHTGGSAALFAYQDILGPGSAGPDIDRTPERRAA